MLNIFLNMLGVISMVAFGAVFSCFAIAFVFTLFHWIFRILQWSVRLTGLYQTIKRLFLIIRLYLIADYSLRSSSTWEEILLVEYRGYRLMCTTNWKETRSSVRAFYIKTDYPDSVDRYRVTMLSERMTKLPNWGHRVSYVWASEESIIDPLRIVMMINNPDETKKWGLVPMIVALSILTLPRNKVFGGPLL